MKFKLRAESSSQARQFPFWDRLMIILIGISKKIRKIKADPDVSCVLHWEF